MRRLTLLDESEPKRPSQPPGPASARERVATRWVAIVPVDEAGTLAFTSAVLASLRERSITATVLLEAPRFPGAVLENDARVPTGLDLHGARLQRVLCSEESAREAWVRALTAAGPGPCVVVGTEALGQVEPMLSVAITGGTPMGLSAPRYRQVRALVDAELDAARPAFAAFLAERLAGPADA